MLKIFELIGRYFILMGKVFSRPEKRAIYRRRIIYEICLLYTSPSPRDRG